MKSFGLRKETVLAYSFLIPILLFYTIFLVIPVVFSFVISLTEWGGFDLESMTFVGLDNYKKIFASDSTFLDPILTNTFVFAFGSVALSFIAAMMVSFLITRLRWQGLWRSIYFLPAVTTIVAIGNVWLYIYNPTNGILNEILTSVGLKPVNFLDNPSIALWAVIAVSGWLGIGGAVLILTAGLKGIPHDYYEAASLEGAGMWRQYFSITLPLLRPTILFVLITSFIGGLQSFTLTLVMTRTGGPGNSTNVGALEMYNQAFSFGNWGVASAMAFVLFVVIFIITMIQLIVFRKGGVESY
ncbi:carbohydrate ABC transporter permease [Paenibacillus mendelii]|uniref:Carbohydrate ABC transporter permease n=1 Tax=Paenibacillus mendelii TaxID=206163 RepID=A0ABV6JCK8_9BACL|nr:sugar ABC transporter permease [Paenibacillus mendelii]MCQ6561629.1 sugar ABC transporter permease [Paenibacillus mendelii]